MNDPEQPQQPAQNVHIAGGTVGQIVKNQYNFSNTPDPAARERTLRALLHDHSGFIASRLEAFVGREAELAAIR